MLYLYKCARCGATRELYRPIEERDRAPSCMSEDRDCVNTPMRRVLSAPAIRGENVAKP